MLVVDRSENDIVIRVRTLFEIEINNINELTKKKVRLVGRGDVQKRIKMSKNKCLASVASAVSTKIFLVVSLDFDDLRQGDITTDFLNGRLKIAMFLELPKDHKQKNEKQKFGSPKLPCMVHGKGLKFGT